MVASEVIAWLLVMLVSVGPLVALLLWFHGEDE